MFLIKQSHTTYKRHWQANGLLHEDSSIAFIGKLQQRSRLYTEYTMTSCWVPELHNTEETNTEIAVTFLHI